MSAFRLSLLAAALVLAGCATAPKPLQGDYAAALPEATAAPAGKVRWGGEVIRVDTDADRSCFEVLARPLDGRARPQRGDHNGGRFLACRKGFYDPAVFTPGREITVVGQVDGSELRKVGDYDYRYPRVAADVIYLWNEPRRDYYADPWFHAWDPFWYRPFGPPRIVIRTPHHHH